MTDVFVKVKAQLEKQLPFVLYAKPKADRMIALFQENDSLHFLKDFSEKGFVFAPFDGDAIPYIPQAESEVYVEKIKETDFLIAPNPIIEADEAAKRDFEALVTAGVDAIGQGAFEKVVLSRKAMVAIPSFELETVFKKLVAFYPTAFKYCFFHPKIGLWLGASPEQFLKINQEALQTVALAGTQAVTDSTQLVWQEKEIEEQQLVTDFITQSLSDKVSGLTVSSPYSVQAGNLWHIKTDIAATIGSNSNLEEIIKSLHPTSAVCGLPKAAAKDFILQNESYDRSYYSGFLGELNIDLATFRTEQTDLFVNLRCMKINDKHVELFIGCGITKDSVPEAEFIETVNKSMTMRKVLN
ncbi:MAG: isochorismate synthase [Flavobacterium sp.]|uniref:isochorismate synthase n=1 Tax=Flavobacterium sp. TaxID=239 RepID=UPI0025C1A86E|nr:isochorismate synthase [Flavobacterium sp.]MBA4135028.1 isochorismate synthase [Flavobacterium sp.]